MATSASAKRKREEEDLAEECFENWRKTRSHSSIAQEGANMNRWFRKHIPEASTESPTGARKSLEEVGDLGLLEEYYRQEFAQEHNQLEQSFYDCDAVTLARRLLGKFLYNKDCIILRITETEAYQEGDSIFEALFGKERCKSYKFERGGTIFEHERNNGRNNLFITAGKEGEGAVVIIKACSIVAGRGIIELRINLYSPMKPEELLNSPGKVGEALRETLFPQPLHHESYGISLPDGATPERMLVGPRVCKRRADPQDLSKPWRFAIAGTPWISNPHNTLVPLT